MPGGIRGVGAKRTKASIVAWCMTEDLRITEDTIDLAGEVIAKLKASGAMLATVESCTGGLIASRLTDISGSSEVFWGSWVTYDNSAKQLLGVPAALIEEHGAVSPEVALAMARVGLAALTSVLADGASAFCLATTGIAGPSGGSERKPVGLCHVACASMQGATTREIRGEKGLNRTENKAKFADEALRLLLGQ